MNPSDHASRLDWALWVSREAGGRREGRRGLSLVLRLGFSAPAGLRGVLGPRPRRRPGPLWGSTSAAGCPQGNHLAALFPHNHPEFKTFLFPKLFFSLF